MFDLLFENFDKYCIIFIPIAIILLFYYYFKFFVYLSKRRKEQKEILNNIKPRKFILEDIIIVKVFGHPTPRGNDKIIKIGRRNNDLRYKIIPVIRDVETNELLMSIKENCYGSYKYYWEATIFSNKVYWYMTRKDNTLINIGDCGNYYLKEYVNHDLKIEYNIIYLDGIKYTYMGNIDDSRPLKEIGNCLLFNSKKGTGIIDANKIKFFKGYIDF